MVLSIWFVAASADSTCEPATSFAQLKAMLGVAWDSGLGR
jgi:hypothetical protein